MKTESLLVLFAAFVLSACSTPRESASIQSPAPVMDAASGPSGKSTQGGGYLVGDGPGADADAPDLDAIPDAVVKPEPFHRYANRQYSALGKTYTPLQTTGHYKERGMASWYGKKFHGQRTSIGEIYNMYAMTAAHPTLPIPSYARVTNLANGKSVVVRVNDRGPFLHDRIIDLSYVAAYKLGFVNSGSAEVEVESLSADGTAPVIAGVAPTDVQVAPLNPAPAAPVIPVENAGAHTGEVFLQLGAFKSPQGAESFLARMRSELVDTSRTLSLYKKGGLTRVHFGPYANANEARAAASRLASSLGFKPFVSWH
jgi:rare lipoprotein A